MAVWNPVWLAVIAVAAIAGWWLSVRPGSSYRGASTTMSVLIVLMAILLCILAVRGQGGSPAVVYAAGMITVH